eukprot:TRINITY_DN9637_c0_g1_i1.p1 TRINITY_DN9637_c0_g1~~TRINITY_DN9637_c0_g1_i1.p1  ORF type:complete len:985 (+),score=222.07 TRINITY_DN9637_c0_g1_i1:2-2956(+)
MMAEGALAQCKNLSLSADGAYLYIKNPYLQVVCRLNRLTRSISCIKVQEQPDDVQELGKICAILGTINLLTGWHLMVVKNVSAVGAYQHDVVYAIEDAELIPLSPEHKLCSLSTNNISQDGDVPRRQTASNGQHLLTEDVLDPGTSTASSLSKDMRQHKMCGQLHKRHIKMINKLFKKEGGFYFTYSGNLLLSLQQLADVPKTKKPGTYVWQHPLADEHFWNKAMMADFLATPALHAWVLPIIQGFYGTASLDVDAVKTSFTLVSRRSRHRLGCRYKRRGLAEDGHVANSVESEMIVSQRNKHATYLQYRGSIPVFWSQEPQNREYRPAVQLERTPAETQTAFVRHLERLVTVYGPYQFWVNLVNRHGREDVVGSAFHKTFAAVAPTNISYFAYDFHQKCKRGSMQNVWEIVDAAGLALRDMGYGRLVEDDQGLHLQNRQQGVVRVNCMDCLDRTNVTQSVLARAAVQSMLAGFGFTEKQLPPDVIGALQTIWAANGNYISRQYAGTDAMKSEATKAKKSKLLSALNDGRKSLTRYYLNNFHDAYRQQLLDLCQFERDPASVFAEGLRLNSEQLASLQESAQDFVARVVPKVIGMEQFLGAWPMYRRDEVVTAESIFLLTVDALYVIYVNFKDETIASVSRCDLAHLQQAECGLLPPLELKRLGLHAKGKVTRGDQDAVRAKGKYPVLRLIFKHEASVGARIGTTHNTLWFSELEAIFPNDHLLPDYPPIEDLEPLDWDRTRPLIDRASEWTAREVARGALELEEDLPTVSPEPEMDEDDQDLSALDTSILSGILIDDSLVSQAKPSHGLVRQRSKTLPPTHTQAQATASSPSNEPVDLNLAFQQQNSARSDNVDSNDSDDSDDDEAQPDDIPERSTLRDKLASMNIDLHKDLIVAPEVHADTPDFDDQLMEVLKASAPPLSVSSNTGAIYVTMQPLATTIDGLTQPSVDTGILDEVTSTLNLALKSGRHRFVIKTLKRVSLQV